MANIQIKFPVMRSEKQVQLEANGCVFRGQEALDNHQLDKSKPCYCGRPNAKKKIESKV